MQKSSTLTDNKVNVPTMKQWALRYAELGIPIFPCKPGGKAPIGELVPNGVLNATTDRSRIHAWWTRHPDASIGMACGSISGYVAADLDKRTPEALEIWNSLNETRTSKTGRESGEGRHRFYRVPRDKEFRTRHLANGALSIIGDGNYIILPPSLHESGRRYEWLPGQEIADLPEGLVADDEVTRGKDGSEPVGCRFTAGDDTAIPEGSRNNTLTSIGGWLRACGQDVGHITTELRTINALRCNPPLPTVEVEGIAKSVCRYPAGDMPVVDAQTRVAIDSIQDELWETRWKNKSDRDVVISLLNVARRNSRMSISGDGVEISISYRALALAAAVSLETARKAVNRLIASGWLRKGRNGSGTRAGSFVLLRRAQLVHSDQVGGGNKSKSASVLPLRAPRLRHSCTIPVSVAGRRVDTIVIKRLGKTAGAVIDLLTTHGPSDIGEIASALHVKRPRDLRRRVVKRLVERGIVKFETGDIIRLVGNWEQALDVERTRSGEKEAYRRDKDRYERQREAYLDRNRVQARRFSEEDMEMKGARPISELELIEEEQLRFPISGLERKPKRTRHGLRVRREVLRQ